MAHIQLERLPTNDDELYELVKVLWGTTIPRTQVCPDHVSPFSAFADAYFNRDGSIALWHGSRGLSGKSFMLSVLGITKAFLLGADTNMLGGSLAQSTNIHEHMRSALDHVNAPRQMIESEGNYLIRLNNKARIRPLTASQKTVRGPHPPFLILDEIDEMDEDILNAALGQPMPQVNYLGNIVKPYTVMCSTWQNPDSTFEHKYREFEEKGLPIKTWCYRESANPVDGWLDPETIEQKKREIPKEMWRVEYELGEPSIGNRAFDSEAIEKTFCKEVKPVKQDHRQDFEEYTFEEPVHKGIYIASADWAKEQDKTVITVMRVDKQPHELVYYLRVNRRPYPMMIGWFNDAIEKYNAEAIHDATGLGNVVNDYIDVRARKFIMAGEKRYNMLSEYVGAIERGYFALPRIPTLYSAHKYCRTGDIYSGATKDYHLPDEVCSLALAWHTAKNYSGYGIPVALPKSNEPGRYEKHFSTPHEIDTLSSIQGEVAVKSAEEEHGISLTI
jgi:hypothetical protein